MTPVRSQSDFTSYFFANAIFISISIQWFTLALPFVIIFSLLVRIHMQCCLNETWILGLDLDANHRSMVFDKLKLWGISSEVSFAATAWVNRLTTITLNSGSRSSVYPLLKMAVGRGGFSLSSVSVGRGAPEIRFHEVYVHFRFKCMRQQP